MGIQDDGYTGQADPMARTHLYNALSFMVSQIMAGNWTVTLAVVKTVTGGGIDGPAIVGVQPMVNQLDGAGNSTPHGIISNIPAFRLQGGASAFIADPAVGDIGLLACASSDISAVKNNKAPSNPGSFRTFDPADGLFIGGFFNAAPTQYIQITEDGISIVFPGGISIALSSAGITLAVGNTSIVIADGTITIGGIVWGTHLHSGVMTGGGESGPPVA
jgi:hypothetical protein